MRGKDRERCVHLVGERRLDDVWRRAGQMLGAHWASVERVADALTDKGRLSGDEVRELVRAV